VFLCFPGKFPAIGERVSAVHGDNFSAIHNIQEQVSIYICIYKLLHLGRFHPFYRPRRPLGRVEV
jgi:hypothetical protein